MPIGYNADVVKYNVGLLMSMPEIHVVPTQTILHLVRVPPSSLSYYDIGHASRGGWLSFLKIGNFALTLVYRHGDQRSYLIRSIHKVEGDIVTSLFIDSGEYIQSEVRDA